MYRRAEYRIRNSKSRTSQAGGKSGKTGSSSGGGRIYPSAQGQGKDLWFKGAREGIDATSWTNTYLADSKAAGS